MSFNGKESVFGQRDSKPSNSAASFQNTASSISTTLLNSTAAPFGDMTLPANTTTHSYGSESWSNGSQFKPSSSAGPSINLTGPFKFDSISPTNSVAPSTTPVQDRFVFGRKQGGSVEEIKERFDQMTEREKATTRLQVQQWPFAFSLVELNDIEAVKLFLEWGLDVNVKDFHGVPLLAHAIMYSKVSGDNVLELVKTLLANGADPADVPQDMWSHYIETPKVDDILVNPPVGTPWWQRRRQDLVDTLTLGIRYSLFRAERVFKVTGRRSQIAGVHGITPLFKIANLIVGQEKAAEMVISKIFARFAMTGKERPLVMAFSGLSGHGKTELASQLGPLLSLEMVEIDCTQIRSAHELLGPPVGYVGNAKGSPLNNFLSAQSGKRSIVFLDEYDKTNGQVRQALMKVMESGE